MNESFLIQPSYEALCDAGMFGFLREPHSLREMTQLYRRIGTVLG